MVARKPRKSAPEIRTSRLVLEGPDGRELAVLEPGETGPTFKLLDPHTGEERVLVAVEGDQARVSLRTTQGRRRVSLRAIAEGSELTLHSPVSQVRPADAMVSISVYEECASVDLSGAFAFPDGAVTTEPRASLSNRTPSTPKTGHLVLYDDGYASFEVPLSRELFVGRLRQRLSEAAAQAVKLESWAFTPDELLAAFCEASDTIQGDVMRLAGQEPARNGATDDQDDDQARRAAR